MGGGERRLAARSDSVGIRDRSRLRCWSQNSQAGQQDSRDNESTSEEKLKIKNRKLNDYAASAEQALRREGIDTDILARRRRRVARLGSCRLEFTREQKTDQTNKRPADHTPRPLYPYLALSPASCPFEMRTPSRLMPHHSTPLGRSPDEAGQARLAWHLPCLLDLLRLRAPLRCACFYCCSTRPEIRGPPGFTWAPNPRDWTGLDRNGSLVTRRRSRRLVRPLAGPCLSARPKHHSSSSSYSAWLRRAGSHLMVAIGL